MSACNIRTFLHLWLSPLCVHRWTGSRSSSRVTEFCTGRRQGCPPRGRGWPRTWRFPRRGPSCSRRSRKASCMRSRFDRTSTSSRGWTANRRLWGPLKNVRRHECKICTVLYCFWACERSKNPIIDFLQPNCETVHMRCPTCQIMGLGSACFFNFFPLSAFWKSYYEY